LTDKYPKGENMLKLDYAFGEDGDLIFRLNHTRPEDVLAASENEIFEELGLSTVFPEDIGALTDAPIVTLDDPLHPETVYWYPDYQIRDWREELASKGWVLFDVEVSGEGYNGKG
jgi:hypothetical protein